MPSTVQLALKAIQHVGIPVTDIRASENFYRSLGFANVMEAEFTQPDGKGTCIMDATRSNYNRAVPVARWSVTYDQKQK